MRKIIYFSGMVVLACYSIANTSAFNLCDGKDNVAENIEALASGELPGVGGRYSCAGKISSNENYGKVYTQRYCGDCKEHSITREWGVSNCFEK